MPKAGGKQVKKRKLFKSLNETMKGSSVRYKFESSSVYDIVYFNGPHISVGDFKLFIEYSKLNFVHYDMTVTNAVTMEEYTDDTAFIEKDTTCNVARVLPSSQTKESPVLSQGPVAGGSKAESKVVPAVNPARQESSEEDKIRAIITQSTQHYDPSNYVKFRAPSQTGEAPPYYICFKCLKPGHWIKNCPLGKLEPIEVKKSTGIPRSFMVPVDGPLVPGALMMPTGTFAVPAIDHQTYKEGKKLQGQINRPPFSQEAETVVEKPENSEDAASKTCKDQPTTHFTTRQSWEEFQESMASSLDETTWEPLRLTHLKPSFNNQELALASRQNVWHKFIIFNAGKYDKEEVLTSVIMACEPEVLVPVMYRTENNDKGTFLTKCSPGAIENLVKQNLSVTMPSGQVLDIDVVLGFLGVDELQLHPPKIVAHTLHHRYDPVRKVLNLDNFQNEKSLGSIYCPISAPNIFQFVLRSARMGILGHTRDMRLPIRELSLRNNGISAIMPFEKFFNYHLNKLDLRHNQISNIDYLRYFAEGKILELWLDGNPLCTKYTSPEDYIRAVRSIFPHIQKLDGILIGLEKKMIPPMQCNYLGDCTKLGLIKQFVRHFFTLYDQDDRIVMNGLYDTDAFYSMTVGNAPNYAQKGLTKVFASNRNLLKFVDYAKCREFISRGPEKIISALRRQPQTTHNFKTFQVDLLHQDENYAAIAVQGLFYYKSLIYQLMLFNRTFIIVAKEDDEYSIVNDQYHIDVAPASFHPSENKDLRFDPKDAPRFRPTLLSVSEKDQLLGFLHELTTMNKEFCKKFLEDAAWDVRTAISTFMKAYTVNDVPSGAFK